jgi:hypothetical protein
MSLKARIKQAWDAYQTGSAIFGLLPSSFFQAYILVPLLTVLAVFQGVRESVPTPILAACAALFFCGAVWGIHGLSQIRSRSRVEGKLEITSANFRYNADIVNGEYVLKDIRFVVLVQNRAEFPIRLRFRGRSQLAGRVNPTTASWTAAGRIGAGQHLTLHLPWINFNPPLPLQHGSVLNGSTEIEVNYGIGTDLRYKIPQSLITNVVVHPLTNQLSIQTYFQSDEPELAEA